MAFCKGERQLDLASNYNPPPNYYQHPLAAHLDDDEVHTTFSRQHRFDYHHKVDTQPGPGYYYKPSVNIGRAHKITAPKLSTSTDNQYKINSIPSIPKQSTARAYEQLAPGILVLHEAQQLGGEVGPGSYDPVYTGKKGAAYQFSKNHVERFPQKVDEKDEEPRVYSPKRTEHPRANIRELLKHPEKKIINPSDLCLEMIILREKQMKAEEIPPPGHYYNEKATSGFGADEKPLEFQNFAGKAKRFGEAPGDGAGPGQYELVSVQKLTEGGYIPKARRTKNLFSEMLNTPGPGSYLQPSQEECVLKPMLRHPPIFSSGCVRFIDEQPNATPGPGQYNLQQVRKYKRSRRMIVQSQDKTINSKIQNSTFDSEGSANLFRSTNVSSRRNASQHRNTIGSSSFASKIIRFKEGEDSVIGPGLYDISREPRTKFNRKPDILQKQKRFRDEQGASEIGPGYYEVKDDQIKPKRCNDIFIK